MNITYRRDICSVSFDALEGARGLEFLSYTTRNECACGCGGDGGGGELQGGGEGGVGCGVPVFLVSLGRLMVGVE